jgi:hypothetical protein
MPLSLADGGIPHKWWDGPPGRVPFWPEKVRPSGLTLDQPAEWQQIRGHSHEADHQRRRHDSRPRQPRYAHLGDAFRSISSNEGVTILRVNALVDYLEKMQR